MCGPEDPFSRLSCRSQGSHFKQKSQFTRPFWENLEILASTASIFTQILAHKPPNLEIFSSQAPKFGNFPLTSPPLFRGKCQFASPTLRKSGPHTPTWKKNWVPPRGFYWSAGKVYAVSCLLCSIKLADVASTNLFLLEWKGANSSLTSQFASLQKILQ